MKWCEAASGRSFVLRLEDGEVLHEAIEKFCSSMGIAAATVTVVGGVDAGSRLIVGPEDGRAEKVVPMVLTLDDVHEAHGTGTVFPDEEGRPLLHLHISCGRNGKSVTGCARAGVKVWLVMEVVINELDAPGARRLTDPATGFKLLQPSS